MSCDIHVHVEIKLNGKWEHYNHPSVNRNYLLFAKIAGVRSDHTVEPVAMGRGLPDNLSVTTKLDSELWGTDGHSHSWMTANEAEEVTEWYNKKSSVDYNRPPLFGYLFENSLDSYLKYPIDFLREVALGFEEARVVFWFND